MGRYIEIKKIEQIIETHFYSVISPDYPEIKKFFIGIYPVMKKVNFYKKAINDSPDCIINLDKIDHNITWLPDFLFYGTLKKAIQAIKDNSFPDYISLQS